MRSHLLTTGSVARARASRQPRGAAPIAVRVSLSHTTDFVATDTVVCVASVSHPPAVRQFYLLPKLDCVRVLADGTQGDCVASVLTCMWCSSFVTTLIDFTRTKSAKISYTIPLETPGTFVRARTRKGGEIRKGKGKGAPVWTDGRKKGAREGGWITVKRCARTATRRRPAGMLFPTAAAHSERSSKEGLHCTVKCARRSPVRRRPCVRYRPNNS